MKAPIVLSVFVVAATLGGCDAIENLRGGKSNASEDDGAESDDETKKKSLADELPGDSGDDANSGVDQAVTCGSPSTIPPIPSTRSKPPTAAEWGKACDLNTQGEGSQPPDCTMKVMREWLQVTCRGNVRGYENLTDFGSEGADYFKQIQLGQLGSFVVRLKKGRNQKVRICRAKDRASLFVSWPPSKDNPSIVALGIGPGCERNASFKTE